MDGKMARKKRDKFVRYSERAEMYHMSQSKPWPQGTTWSGRRWT